MIGNDVVDIAQSRHESNWQRPGFVQKIFTVDEQQLIANAPQPEIMVWLLWSMKEAAYKIYNRETKIRNYAPKKFKCAILSQNSMYITGQVICSENLYYTRTLLEDDAIHTVAVTCIDDLKNVIEVKGKEIAKDLNGIPYLCTDIQNVFQDVSVSHHGRFEKTVTLSPNNELQQYSIL